jgi:hypothetical protein
MSTAVAAFLSWWDTDATLLYILQPQDNLVDEAQGVEADGMGDELLLYPLEVEISSVAEEFLAMVFVADIDGIPAQQPKQLSKGVGVAIRHRRREDGWRAYQPLAVEAGEEVVWLREEEGEAEGEVVGRVGRVVEDVARDLEFAMADGHEDALLVELRDELGD